MTPQAFSSLPWCPAVPVLMLYRRDELAQYVLSSWNDAEKLQEKMIAYWRPLRLPIEFQHMP
jgi:hypothetical protein